jgi:hypothetical protein
MRRLTLLIVFLFSCLQGCSDLKEHVTALDEYKGEITEAPELKISTGIESGQRTLFWTSVTNATAYIIQRDVSYNFTSPELFYMGPNNSLSLSPSPDGLTRYYKVMAKNQKHSGPWSRIIND